MSVGSVGRQGSATHTATVAEKLMQARSSGVLLSYHGWDAESSSAKALCLMCVERIMQMRLSDV